MNTFLSIVFSVSSGAFVIAAWTPELITALCAGIGGIITGVLLILDRLKHVEKSVNGTAEKAIATAVEAAEARGAKREQERASELAAAHARGVAAAAVILPVSAGPPKATVTNGK